MRTARTLFAVTALVLAACSSDGDDASGTATVPDTETEATTTALEPEPTEPEAAPSSDAADEVTPVETEPVDTEAEAETETGVSNDAADDSVAPNEPDEPLVIDGPAEVRPSCASLTRGVSNFTLDAGGAVHDVRLFVPTAVSSDPAPTVLNWHGLGSNGAEQAAFSGYETLAEEEGFIVVHATGVDAGDGRTSWELAQFDAPDRDDLAFADALIDLVVADWCADPTRVYSTGMSNGGLFTSELVCNRSTRIAAAASIAGTTHASTCAPERSVPYVAFHGTADTIVPFDGDEPSLLLPPAAVDLLIDETTPGEFAEFAADAGCALMPTGVEETAEVVRYDYVECDGDVPMVFYEIVGGGHTWPSSPLSGVLSESGLFTQDIDATSDAWAFMSRFSL